MHLCYSPVCGSHKLINQSIHLSLSLSGKSQPSRPAMASTFSTVGAANRTPVSSFEYEYTPLQHAKKLGAQKNARKWICIATLIFLIIIVIIVVGTIQPWQTNKGA
ncbi:hypothetical protein RHMOL_Rhmol03G0062300 [Rhododendron molle]|uniref:Uncharacterized protein n=1 Tax=Rhododendron molle TaxID=49168 RepID=A0ACC0PC73_RHOML|nr:hypothetical protein RHMOL_Rhmol03G0062300 [Rhododendron molle]